jgi:hypothetical protein
VCFINAHVRWPPASPISPTSAVRCALCPLGTGHSVIRSGFPFAVVVLNKAQRPFDNDGSPAFLFSVEPEPVTQH